MKRLFFICIILCCLTSACTTSDNEWIYQYYTPENDFVPVKIDKSMTFFDTKKATIAKGAMPFDFAGCFYDGIALVEKDRQYYFINKKFEPINQEKYVEATHFSDGRAWVVKDFGKISAIDNKGNIVFVFDEAEKAYPFRDGVAVFKNHEGKFGIVDKNGKVVVEAKYDAMDECSTHNAVKVGIGDLFGIIDISGKEIMPCLYSNVNYNDNSRLIGEVSFGSNEPDSLFSLTSKKVIVMETGHRQLTPEKDKLYRFYDGYYNSSPRGWCDKKGKVVIYPKYSHFYSTFKNSSVAIVSENGNSASLINRKGEVVSQLPASPRSYWQFDENGLALIRFFDFYEALNEKGEIIISNNYQYIWHISGDIYLCKNQNGTANVVNSKGKILSSSTVEVNFYDKVDLYADHKETTPVNNRYVDIDALLDGLDGVMKECAVDSYCSLTELRNQFAIDTIDRYSKTLKEGSIYGANYEFSVITNYDYYTHSRSITRYVLALTLTGAAGKIREVSDSIWERIYYKYAIDGEEGAVYIPGFDNFQSVLRRNSFYITPVDISWLNGVWQANLTDGYDYLSIDTESGRLVSDDLGYENMGETWPFEIKDTELSFTKNGKKITYSLDFDKKTISSSSEGVNYEMKKSSRIPLQKSSPYSK